MAPTKLIKFCRFTVHSKPNNMTLSIFPGKIPETRNIYIFLISVWSSPNIPHKQTNQSHANLLSIANISRCFFSFFFFFFRFPSDLKIKGSSLKKNCKQLDFHTMILTILIKSCGFIEHDKYWGGKTDAIGF